MHRIRSFCNILLMFLIFTGFPSKSFGSGKHTSDTEKLRRGDNCVDICCCSIEKLGVFLDAQFFPHVTAAVSPFDLHEIFRYNTEQNKCRRERNFVQDCKFCRRGTTFILLLLLLISSSYVTLWVKRLLCTEENSIRHRFVWGHNDIHDRIIKSPIHSIDIIIIR